jgi:hypothetical protein
MKEIPRGAALGEHFFHFTEPEAEPRIVPDCVTDNFRRKMKPKGTG